MEEIEYKRAQQRNLEGVEEPIYIFIMVVDTELNMLVKTHVSLYQKQWNLLYVNKF